MFSVANATQVTPDNKSFTMQESAPSPLWPDFIHLGYLVVSALVGIPLNIRALYHFYKAKRRRQKFCQTSTRTFHLFCVHLWIANLCILSFYCLGNAAWLGLWTWRSSVVACRLFRFIAPFGFYLLSNLVVAIAVHIACCVYNPLWTRRMGREGVLLLIGLCWILAAVLSFPNCFLWTVAKPFTDSMYMQCVNILVLHEQQGLITTYEVYHLLTVFWIPLAIICPIYIYVTRQACDLIDRTHYGLVKLVTRWSFKGRCRYKNRAFARTSVTNATEHFVLVAASAASAYIRPRLESNAKKRRALATTLEIILSYVLCWLPYQVVCLWHTFHAASFQQYYRYVDWLEALVTLHACFNPLIYHVSMVPRNAA